MKRVFLFRGEIVNLQDICIKYDLSRSSVYSKMKEKYMTIEEAVEATIEARNRVMENKCKNGHIFTINKRGKNYCPICRSERNSMYKRKKEKSRDKILEELDVLHKRLVEDNEKEYSFILGEIICKYIKMRKVA